MYILDSRGLESKVLHRLLIRIYGSNELEMNWDLSLIEWIEWRQQANQSVF